ncbi:MAG TPA: BlaI/MecI/CopY family transcriptional regulator [Candidatus Acidoferrum sp.]|jgi:predicted transcriptional regulator|nr:BlaI/MecI/CopY family transcriptional regulator [Candidatus Acidoferrum sp.]
MSRKKSLVLTDHELRLMEVLWARQRATVAEVVEALLPPPLAYTTVLSTLRTLEQKGYVAHEEDGRAYIYRPLVARESAAKSAIDHLLDRFFKNAPGDFAVALLDDTRLSDADIAKIKKLLGRRKGAP